ASFTTTPNPRSIASSRRSRTLPAVASPRRLSARGPRGRGSQLGGRGQRDVPCQVVVQRQGPSNRDLELRVGGAVRQSDGRHELIRQCALERPAFKAALVPASAAHLSAPQDDLFRQPAANRCPRLHAELCADLLEIGRAARLGGDVATEAGSAAQRHRIETQGGLQFAVRGLAARPQRAFREVDGARPEETARLEHANRPAHGMVQAGDVHFDFEGPGEARDRALEGRWTEGRNRDLEVDRRAVPQRIEDAHAPAPDLAAVRWPRLRRPQARIRYRAPLPKSVRYSSPVSPSPNELMVRLVSSIWCGN